MFSSPFRIRQAQRGDLAALLAMPARSIRALGRRVYTPEAVECLVGHIGTMDPEVIDEGHFHVAVTLDGWIAGSGGWSRRVPGYDGGPEGPSPAALRGPGEAVIRSVFVAPEWARHGIASALVRHAEATAAAAGLVRVGLTATLSGLPLYRRLGYRTLRRKPLTCCAGVAIETVEMAKRLSGPPDSLCGVAAA